jgi:hypothetical protein
VVRTGGQSIGTQGGSEWAVEQAVRGYLARRFRRFGPGLVLAGILVLVLALVPPGGGGRGGAGGSGTGHAAGGTRAIGAASGSGPGGSANDNKKGGYRDCDGGAYFPANDPSAYGSPHTQLHCFGQ